MKIRTIFSYTSTVAALAGMPFLAQRVQAGPIPLLGQVSVRFGAPQSRYQPNWSDDQRKELRYIFYQLEHANQNYLGHRANAMREIQRAGEAMGMDPHGPGYAPQWQGSPDYYGGYVQPERQDWSDNNLRRCRERLMALANTTQDPVRRHLFKAVHELDRALRVR